MWRDGTYSCAHRVFSRAFPLHVTRLRLQGRCYCCGPARLVLSFEDMGSARCHFRWSLRSWWVTDPAPGAEEPRRVLGALPVFGVVLSARWLLPPALCRRGRLPSTVLSHLSHFTLVAGAQCPRIRASPSLSFLSWELGL